MNIASFLLFMFASIGFTHIVVDSVIFAPIKKFLQAKLPDNIGKVFDCYQCAGTWCGFLTGAVLLSWNPLVWIPAGFASSFLSYWAAIYLTYLEAKTVVEMPTSKESDDN